ncbi:unnamed protein product [Clonostachys rosea]|uniref:Uncharacterized protein n=1 Tax=Bionectria ochroleuca TaxID=29856 RepID=A0ABY6TT86_BIOOC|nr:unnamed protein product [Clonostachys rosea]
MLAAGTIGLVLLLFTADALAVNLQYSARYKGLKGQPTPNGHNAGTIPDDEAAFIRANCGAWGYNCSPAGRNPLVVKYLTISESKPASVRNLEGMRSRVDTELKTYRDQRDAAAAASNNNGGVNAAPGKGKSSKPGKLGKNKPGKNNKPGPSAKKPRGERKRKRNVHGYY